MANPTITITNEGASYVYSPAQLDAKIGQAVVDIRRFNPGNADADGEKSSPMTAATATLRLLVVRMTVNDR